MPSSYQEPSPSGNAQKFIAANPLNPIVDPFPNDNLVSLVFFP
jgi:hypothetical protein